ncbi:metallophosphoesterase [Spongiivirga sp. MCCC 1A20706]|uniref:metallophosphoesterase family protein n=1 Tax=Spongiivirga sp. MCCC 1A20706 TaxID=3160963 RepID=UPI0039777E91
MSIKIAHITDLHLDEAFPHQHGIQTRKRFDRILNEITKEEIDEIVCTGDISENGGLPYFFEQLKSQSLYITLGNHDTFDQVSAFYNHGADYRTQKMYSSKIGDHYKYLFLDSSSGLLDYKQLSWLKKELFTLKPIIIFMHHPIMKLNLKIDEVGGTTNGEEILALLTDIENNVTIFCGHYHMESMIVHKNVTQYITPAVSYLVEKIPDKIKINSTKFGYRMIELSKNEISSRVKLFKDAD